MIHIVRCVDFLHFSPQELMDAALQAPEGATAGLLALAAWLQLAAIRKLRCSAIYTLASSLQRCS